MNRFAKISLGLTVGLCSQQLLAETVIDRLPFTADKAGETYVLSGDLTTSGTAITVAADNVVLDGRGHTITYANSQQGYGVNIDYPVTALEVKNFRLNQGNYDPRSHEEVHGINRKGEHRGLNIHHNTININHTGSQAGAYGFAVRLTGNNERSYGNRIDSNEMNITGTSAGYGVSVLPNATWQGKIGYNKITMWDMEREPAGYGRAIHLGGRGPVEIHNNLIDLKSSLFQVQGISLWGGNGYIIRDNVIKAASYKTRGILIDGNSDDNRILRNKITMTSKRADGDASTGIRVRFGSDRNMVYQNEIDASDSVMSYPIRVGGSTDFGRPRGTIIRDNKVRGAERALALEDAGDVLLYNNDIEGVGSGYAVYVYGSDNVSFNHDRIKGPVRFHAGSIYNIDFCSTGLDEGQISDGVNAGYRIHEDTCGYPSKDIPLAPARVSAK